MNLSYEKTKDIKNQDILFDHKTNFQVMMEWEKPYMEGLIKNLKPKGHVLEIGFGLGYSSNEIQKYNIESHTIIEPIMINEVKKWALKQKSKVNIVEGFWQKVLYNLGKFDTIFFDDAPTKIFQDPLQTRVYKFFYLLLNNHVNKDAKFSFYCDKKTSWLCHPDTEYSMNTFKINVPEHCNYTKGSELYMPVIKFKKGIVKDYNHIGLTKDFKIVKI